MTEGAGHVRRNRDAWDVWAEEYAEPGRRNWADDEPRWGIWGLPEADVQMLPPEVGGQDVVELGCGTAYLSAWLARRGARPVGVDASASQLATARRLQAEFGLAFPLVQADAERTPLRDGSFDLVISEYGACLWCDPYQWIPEAARLLRPGGRLSFLVHSPLLMLCMPDEVDQPAEDRMIRPYFGMHRFEWSDDPSVEFHLPHGELLGLLRSNGFDVEALRELRPPDGAGTRYKFAPLEWAQRWPSEEVWVARKTA